MKTFTINNEQLTFYELYYVSPNGNDNNDGLTSDTPLATLECAINKCDDDNLCGIYMMAGRHILKPIYSTVIDSSEAGVVDLGKPIHIFGENAETILYYDATVRTHRDGPAFLIENAESIVSNFVYEYKPFGSASYNRAVFKWCRGFAKNIYLKNVGTNAFSMMYDNEAWSNDTAKMSLINCIFDFGVGLDNDYSGMFKDVKNCIFSLNLKTACATNENNLVRDILESDITNKDLSDDIVGKGVDENGDPTNIGVTGGLLAWSLTRFLIYQNNKYYTILNGAISEIIPTNISKEIIVDNGCFLSDISLHIDDLADEFEIVCNEKRNLSILSVPNNEELITANNDFPTSIQSNIDYFENQSDLSNNGSIKIAFSIDEGATWKTHDGTDFIDLPITIPCKPYNELTEDELIQWNNARDEILANGIDSATLKNLDFNTLSFDKIRFAYVLHVEDVKDVALNKKLTWQFDAKGSMKLMKDDEIDIEVLSTGIKVTPKVDSSLIKLNIVTDK